MAVRLYMFAWSGLVERRVKKSETDYKIHENYISDLASASHMYKVYRLL